MAIIKGFNLIVEKAGTRIAGQTDCTLNVSTELIEKAGTATGWREYLAGLSEWTVDCSGLLMGTQHTSMIREQVAKTALTLSFSIGGEVFSGQAYIESCQYQGNVKGSAKWQVSFTGTGALS